MLTVLIRHRLFSVQLHASKAGAKVVHSHVIDKRPYLRKEKKSVPFRQKERNAGKVFLKELQIYVFSTTSPIFFIRI